MFIARLIGMILSVINIVLISYLYKRAIRFRPIAWVLAAWMIHTLVYYLVVIISINIVYLIPVEFINTWSTAVRLHALGSLMTGLILGIVMDIRNKKQ